MDLCDRLSRYAAEFELATLSEPDRAHLIDAFVNWVGCAIGGANAPATIALAGSCRTLSPGGNASVLGSDERFAVVDAVAIDCLASAVHAFDDTHLETVLHPTGPVAAALLGQARLQPVSGTQFLTALHVGMEIECRTALAITSPGARAKKGWYITGITGGIGAAAAVGRLLGFGVTDMAAAIGMAAARASGNRGTHGSMAAAYVPSLAAESGIVAAHLTRNGLICGARAFDGSSGLLELLTEAADVDRALLGLGTFSEAARTTFKPYPAGIVAHPMIDACLTLYKNHGARESNLVSLVFLVSRTASQLVANKHPRNVVEAQVSLYFWGSVALRFGAASVEYADPGSVTDEQLTATQNLMSASVDDQLADDQCIATAHLSDGSSVRVFIEHATGSLSRPMTQEAIDRKFFSLAFSNMTSERAQRLHRACRDILNLQQVDTILSI